MLTCYHGHTYHLIVLSLGAFIDHGHHLVGIGSHDFVLLTEAFQHTLISFLGQLIGMHRLLLLCSKGNFHGHDLQEALAASFPVIVLYDIAHAVPYHVADIHAQSLTHQCMMTLLIDYGALFVHHIIILEQALAHSEVVLLHLLLCILNAASNHAVLYHLSVLEAQFVHHAGNTLVGKQTHEVIFQ